MILWGFTKFNFTLSILKNKNVLSLKKYFLSLTAKIDPKDGISHPNFQWRFWSMLRPIIIFRIVKKYIIVESFSSLNISNISSLILLLDLFFELLLSLHFYTYYSRDFMNKYLLKIQIHGISNPPTKNISHHCVVYSKLRCNSALEWA